MEPESRADFTRWSSLWQQLGGASPDSGLFQLLVSRYSEPHRRYHTVRHLEECFALFPVVRDSADHPAEVELALWFHDAVYDPRQHDNEQRSADWARDVVLAAGIGSPTADRVHALVMSTRHKAVPESRDARALVDVDLSILGTSSERFDEYERQVREEYAWVPDPVFRQVRKGILEEFVARPAIFSTAAMRDRLEQSARSNLARSIKSLSH